MTAGFRFDEAQHRYFEGTERLPNITTMLEMGGHIDPRWYTEEGRRRGKAVHDLTAKWDLGLIDRNLHACRSPYVGYLVQHVALDGLVRPEWQHVEVPFMHGGFRFAGTPDRVGVVYGMLSVAEEKTGGLEAWHGIQLALQAILVAPQFGVPAEAIARWGWYLEADRYRLYQYQNGADFREAHRLIRRYCKGVER